MVVLIENYHSTVMISTIIGKPVTDANHSSIGEESFEIPLDIVFYLLMSEI